MKISYKIIITIIVFIISLFLPKINIEGFNTYTSCIEDGYPMDFCTKTPVQTTNGKEYCNCGSGYFGAFHMGEGKCYCYLFNGLLPYKSEQPYESSPF
ncbi:hypothetical protein N8261_03460 [Flavobacteriaceae bacterium]|nr:hypothetical protein [Flavobacteriaceae bacterium]|tara:strand:- start:1244 stop:1537 length:294 start_codon:yes stop_codon:yes gene_type:complete